MNEHESFESELHSLKPSAAPTGFLDRLRAAKPAVPAPTQHALPVARASTNLRGLILRWLLPAAACVATATMIWRLSLPGKLPSAGPDQGNAAAARLKANDVEIGRELVASFDAVARLPGGEPVRFRCQEWMDHVVWRDKHHKLTVEQRTPRFEVVPVRFETY